MDWTVRWPGRAGRLQYFHPEIVFGYSIVEYVRQFELAFVTREWNLTVVTRRIRTSVNVSRFIVADREPRNHRNDDRMSSNRKRRIRRSLNSINRPFGGVPLCVGPTSHPDERWVTKSRRDDRLRRIPGVVFLFCWAGGCVPSGVHSLFHRTPGTGTTGAPCLLVNRARRVQLRALVYTSVYHKKNGTAAGRLLFTFPIIVDDNSLLLLLLLFVGTPAPRVCKIRGSVYSFLIYI